MIEEEIGNADLDLFRFEALSVFLDKTVGELGVLGVLTTPHSVAELNSLRGITARDRARETKGDLIEAPATEKDLINFVLEQPHSVRDFVTYTPHLVNTLLKRKVLRSIS